MDARHILVTGGNGRLGKALGARGCVALGKDALNITDPVSIAAALVTSAPKLVINAASYTTVDKAESEPELTQAINADGAGTLARCCAEAGMPLIHISTDCVFGDHDPLVPVPEDAPTGPQSVYARSKLDAEQQVLASGAAACIARVSWLFDDGDDTFIGKMLTIAQGREAMKIVDDAHGRPTPVGDLAETLIQIVGLLTRGADVPNILHLGTPGPVSRYEWAREIFDASAKLGGPSPSLAPCSSDEFEEAARRPRGLILDVSRADTLLGPMPDWRPACRETVQNIAVRNRRS